MTRDGLSVAPAPHGHYNDKTIVSLLQNPSTDEELLHDIPYNFPYPFFLSTAPRGFQSFFFCDHIGSEKTSVRLL